MVRLFATDMDGTLLNDKSMITERTKQAIIKFKQMGGTFVINTGREFSNAKKELDIAGICCDLICANGAVIYDRYGDVIEEHPLSTELAREIVDILDFYEMYVDIYTNIGRVSIVPAFEVAKYYQEQVLPAYEKDGKLYFQMANALKEVFDQIIYFDGISQIFHSDIKIYKICSSSVNIERMKKVRKKCAMLSQVAMTYTSEYDIELTHEEAQKGSSLLHYAKRRNILIEDILVVGDSENDRSALSLPFGRTVAMGNATTEIKDISKEICGTNQNDAVACLLEQVCMEWEAQKKESYWHKRAV
ncbi:MAG: Cof-type HAD-IIB family hydrolase [Lachnospiraceae bacterium]|nr:Cof-type HAD-IIB family hydrolase [Lachnospiraceae bacterium]